MQSLSTMALYSQRKVFFRILKKVFRSKLSAQIISQKRLKNRLIDGFQEEISFIFDVDRFHVNRTDVLSVVRWLIVSVLGIEIEYDRNQAVSLINYWFVN